MEVLFKSKVLIKHLENTSISLSTRSQRYLDEKVYEGKQEYNFLLFINISTESKSCQVLLNC